MGEVRRWRVILTAVLVAILAGSWLLPARAAGSPLDLSLPAAHAELKESPDSVSLFFSRRVDYDVTAVLVTNSAGNNVRLGRVQVNGANVVAQVSRDLPKGTYTVHWKIDAPGEEVEGGAFQFSVGSGDWTDLSDARWEGRANQPEVFGEVDDFGNPTDSPTPSVTTTSPASPTPSETAVTTPVASPSATPSVTSSPEPTPAPGSGDGGPWTGLGIALVVVAALGTGGVLWARRRDRSPGAGPNA